MGEGVGGELPCGQRGPPGGDEGERFPQIQLEKPRGVRGQVRLGQSKEGIRRSEAALLEVHEGASQLDQPLVEAGPGLPAFAQPEVFEDIVGLVVFAAVEAGEPAGVTGVEASGVGHEEMGDAIRFGHPRRVAHRRGGASPVCVPELPS